MGGLLRGRGGGGEVVKMGEMGQPRRIGSIHTNCELATHTLGAALWFAKNRGLDEIFDLTGRVDAMIMRNWSDQN